MLAGRTLLYSTNGRPVVISSSVIGHRTSVTVTCCVSFVDIVDSTRVTSRINDPEKVRKYYEVFLNTMAAIAGNFADLSEKNRTHHQSIFILIGFSPLAHIFSMGNTNTTSK